MPSSAVWDWPPTWAASTSWPLQTRSSAPSPSVSRACDHRASPVPSKPWPTRSRASSSASTSASTSSIASATPTDAALRAGPTHSPTRTSWPPRRLRRSASSATAPGKAGCWSSSLSRLPARCCAWMTSPVRTTLPRSSGCASSTASAGGRRVHHAARPRPDRRLLVCSGPPRCCCPGPGGPGGAGALGRPGLRGGRRRPQPGGRRANRGGHGGVGRRCPRQPACRDLPATGSHHRAIVGTTLQVERHPEVFVVGDMAEIPGEAGPLPMLAQVAIQSGRHAARSVLALCASREARASPTVTWAP